MNAISMKVVFFSFRVNGSRNRLLVHMKVCQAVFTTQSGNKEVLFEKAEVTRFRIDNLKAKPSEATHLAEELACSGQQSFSSRQVNEQTKESA